MKKYVHNEIKDALTSLYHQHLHSQWPEMRSKRHLQKSFFLSGSSQKCVFFKGGASGFSKLFSSTRMGLCMCPVSSIWCLGCMAITFRQICNCIGSRQGNNRSKKFEKFRKRRHLHLSGHFFNNAPALKKIKNGKDIMEEE